MTKCDGCGQDIVDVAIAFRLCKDLRNSEIDRVEKVFGKLDFSFCYVCWLKSLGAKPKRKR